MKAILSTLLAVTRSGIARVAAEKGLHVSLEVDWRGSRDVVHDDRDDNRLAAQFDAERSRSIGLRLHKA